MLELVRRAETLGISPENVVREPLQKLILYSIAYLNLDSSYVLQGGTALRLFYSSPRFSLDLDFSGLSNDALKFKEDFYKVGKNIAKVTILDNIDFSITREKVFRDEGFYRCFFTFDTSNLLKKKIRIKVEVNKYLHKVANFERKIVELEYPIRTSVGIIVKKPSQILCDKISSLAGGMHRKYFRWRDIFDIYWLVKKQDAKIDKAYLLEEFGSWKEKPEDLKNVSEFLKEIKNRKNYDEAINELNKFLAPLLLKSDLVEEYINVALDIIQEALGEVEK